MNKREITTIRVSKKTKSAFNKTKAHPRETDDETLVNLMEKGASHVK